MRDLRIALDIHGVIDVKPIMFYAMTKKWAEDGCDIHILTGQPWKDAVGLLDHHNITYHHHYSIVDYHRAQSDCNMSEDEDGWWMPEEDWNKSKGVYCEEHKIDICFDNELAYADFMPDTCMFVFIQPESFRGFAGLY